MLKHMKALSLARQLNCITHTYRFKNTEATYDVSAIVLRYLLNHNQPILDDHFLFFVEDDLLTRIKNNYINPIPKISDNALPLSEFITACRAKTNND